MPSSPRRRSSAGMPARSSCASKRYSGPFPPASSSTGRSASPAGMRVEDVFKLVSASIQFDGPIREPGRNARHRLEEVQRELLLAELPHEDGFLLHHDQLALVDDADAVGHLLGLVDVMRGENDGDA